MARIAKLLKFGVLALATLVACGPAPPPGPETPLAAAPVKRSANLSQALSTAGVRLGAPIFIRIFKEESELEVWMKRPERWVLVGVYPICEFSGELGPKLAQGDRQSPEGFYFVGPEQMNPKSKFHLSFDIGYPNAFDRALGRTGGHIMVHGGCESVGCFAMTDAWIEEIYLLAEAAFGGGQRFFRVHVFPFRMTVANLRERSGSPWMPFWRNLKEGYDYFELWGEPPDVEVRDGRYEFRRDREAPRGVAAR